MKSFFSGVALAAALIVTSLPANADQVWNWSWTSLQEITIQDTAVSGGTLTTLDGFNGFYHVIGITGTWEGQPIIGLSTPGSFFLNDNVVYDSQPLLDDSGLAFVVQGPVLDSTPTILLRGPRETDPSLLVSVNDTQVIYGMLTSTEVGSLGIFDLTPAPEPASMALLAGGMLGLAALRRQRG